MAKKLMLSPSEKNKNFNLYEDIKKSPLYKKPTPKRDEFARDFLNSHAIKLGRASGKIVPGQLLLFQYFDPKTKEDLEYYDASPCTIFFGVYNAKEGKRVIGFNIHYFPPRTRWIIMTEIFKIFKPIFMKYWETGITKEIDAFDYSYLMDELERQKLTFGVRQYDPKLIANIYNVPPNCFTAACYTEGWFKKQTREMIMNHWKNMKVKKKK